MPKRLLHATVVLLAIAATGCAAYPGGLSGLVGPAVGTDAAGQPLSLSSLPKMGVSGVVMAPAHVVAAGGGNVVAAGGGNVIAAGGGNVVAAGGGNFAGTRRVLALDQQVAVVGAEVYLADLAGERLPGSPPAVTDAAGRFTLRGAPEDGAYMVVARFQTPTGAGVTLTRLAHPSRNGHDQVVSVATTLVSEAFVKRGTPAARFDPAQFDVAVEAVADRLTEATLPDLTRPDDVAAKAAAIAEDTPAVRQAIDAPTPAGTGPASEPLMSTDTLAIDAPSNAVPPASNGGHKGKSTGKDDGPSGPVTPSAPEVPGVPADEPDPDDAAPPIQPPATGTGNESGTETGEGEPETPSQVTPEPAAGEAKPPAPPASQPPQAGADKDKNPKKEKNQGNGHGNGNGSSNGNGNGQAKGGKPF